MASQSEVTCIEPDGKGGVCEHGEDDHLASLDRSSSFDAPDESVKWCSVCPDLHAYRPGVLCETCEGGKFKRATLQSPRRLIGCPTCNGTGYVEGAREEPIRVELEIVAERIIGWSLAQDFTVLVQTEEGAVQIIFPRDGLAEKVAALLDAEVDRT